MKVFDWNLLANDQCPCCGRTIVLNEHTGLWACTGCIFLLSRYKHRVLKKKIMKDKKEVKVSAGLLDF